MSTQLEDEVFDYDTFQFTAVNKVMRIRDNKNEHLTYFSALVHPLVAGNLVSVGKGVISGTDGSYFIGEADFTFSRKRKINKRRTSENFISCYTCGKRCIMHSCCKICSPNLDYCMGCITRVHKDLCEHAKAQGMKIRNALL